MFEEVVPALKINIIKLIRKQKSIITMFYKLARVGFEASAKSTHRLRFS
jgi:hypothetical protein